MVDGLVVDREEEATGEVAAVALEDSVVDPEVVVVRVGVGRNVVNRFILGIV